MSAHATDGPLKVFFIAGEPSGDSHGGALAKRLLARDPTIQLEGLGGPHMAAAGVKLHEDLDLLKNTAMGLLPVIARLPFFMGRIRDTGARIAAAKPDVLVPIDYPGFNFRMAARARAEGVKVCWYVSPQVWAWRPGRIHKVKRLVDHMMVLFPFEVGLYEEVGVPCTFVGHPLFDELRTRRPTPGFRAGLGLEPSTLLLGLLPGSRPQEIERNLPLILRAATLVARRAPDVRYALPVAQPTLRPVVEAIIAAHQAAHPDAPKIAVLDGKASDVARVARAAICASGTATLELLHHECPTVIVYQATQLQELFVRRLLITPWIGLVNVLAQREVFPEFARAKDASAEIAEAALGLLRDGRARKKCLSAIKNLRREVDLKDIHGTAADTVLAVAREARLSRTS